MLSLVDIVNIRIDPSYQINDNSLKNIQIIPRTIQNDDGEQIYDQARHNE